MDILNEIYFKSSEENEKNFTFWQNYLESLKNLDFSVFSDKLKIPTLVPIGSRILFRGELIHTNEVTAALGADYFVKCSIKQAEVLRQHRIKDAQEKLDMYIKEKDYFENQLSLTRKTLYDKEGEEIIEYYSEEDDKVWRAKHRENVRKYKQNKKRAEETESVNITDEELWERLEELELQEELENELAITAIHTPKVPKNIEEKYLANPNQDFEDNSKEKKEKENKKIIQEKLCNKRKQKPNEITYKETQGPPSKLDILQQVINKQSELEDKLHELKNRKRSQTKNEKDLLSRLDELEQLDDLEDDMDRLEDIIDNEDVEQAEEELDDNEQEGQIPKIQRRVSFVDENDSNTLEITFKHSDTHLIYEPYDASQGIQKPSDIYQAHSNLFGTATTSILKKSKYERADDKGAPIILLKENATPVKFQESGSQEVIIVKDIVEKVDYNTELLSQSRPTSLFKKKRMQNKS
ncbi:unconventional prefoldin RPB5 interactor-like protein [Spodoptera litura]|uniref:Unconventional prefoldin RPB5 interactor-like protein n=1 Tax=Spodoptera litura TaxID=69820 RepID=A0A9J7IP59_SPOLT|nr:unconventional prefoldin RPB5 interactor-like protein [Spodoptera litura]